MPEQGSVGSSGESLEDRPADRSADSENLPKGFHTRTRMQPRSGQKDIDVMVLSRMLPTVLTSQ